MKRSLVKYLDKQLKAPNWKVEKKGNTLFILDPPYSGCIFPYERFTRRLHRYEPPIKAYIIGKTKFLRRNIWFLEGNLEDVEHFKNYF